MANLKLGRGIDALIPKDLDSSMLEEDKNRVQKLLISQIKANPDQPRNEFDETSMAELTESVKRHGVLMPIIVVREGESYKIVAGERRYKAAKSAGFDHIPAVVRSLAELEQIELALIENIQRVDLSPLEQALSVYKLQHQFNLTLPQIAEKLGKAQSTVSNISRLLKLPEEAQEALRQGKITEGHARAILSLDGESSKQAELLGCVINNGWSVRQAEKFAADNKKTTLGRLPKILSEEQKTIAGILSGKLGATVNIRPSKRGGQIIIQFKNNDHLQRIYKTLEKDTE